MSLFAGFKYEGSMSRPFVFETNVAVTYSFEDDYYLRECGLLYILAWLCWQGL
jgi:hypothetical protein